MKRGGSPENRIPFWAQRQFRWLVGIAFLAISCAGALAWKLLSPPPVLPERHQEFHEEADLASPPFMKLQGVKDLTPADETDPAYVALLDRVRETEPGALASAAKRAHWESLAKRPDDYRGRVVRIIALHIHPIGETVDALPVSREDGRVEWVYRVLLMDPSGDEAHVLHLVERPARVEHRSLVTADAVFLKWIRHETKDGEREAPLLAGRTIGPAPRTGAPVEIDEGQLFYGLAAISGVLLFLTVLVFVLGRRAARPRAPRRELPAREPGVPLPEPPGGRWKRPAEWKPPARPPVARFFRRGESRLRRLKPPPGEVLKSGARRSPWPRVLIYVLALGGVVLYLVAPWRVDPIRQSHEKAQKVQEAARQAAAAIRDRESKVWLRGEPLSDDDRAAIRKDLAKVVEADDEMHRHLDVLRRKGSSPGDVVAAMHRDLLRTKLWVLDAEAVAENEKDGKEGDRAPGIFIPYHLALDRLVRAEKDLSPSQAEPAKREAALAEIAAAEKDLRDLAARVREGLARPELNAAELPELAEIEAAARKAEELRKPAGG